MNQKKNIRVPIDKRVIPGVILIFILCGVSLILLPSAVVIPTTLFCLFLHVSFFRDPCRKPAGEGVLSPADGKIVEISICDEPRYIQGKAIKVGIFLSVLDVHVNRMPWKGVLEWQEHIPGKFLDARDPESAKQNECNWMGFADGDKKFVVRQISGLIARHIHWDVKKGEVLAQGDKTGMICYGSRAELYLPADQFETLAHLGDVVKSAETVVGIWKK